MYFIEKGRQMLLKDNLIDEEALKQEARAKLSCEEKLSLFEENLDILTTRYSVRKPLV